METDKHPLFSPAMLLASDEARRWLGATSPNPAVGAAALDEAGQVLAVAAHHRAGGDHAEAALLKLCQERHLLPRVHTMCVTLEPCNHFGRTPPCSEAIIAAGIRRVVVGHRDPNPKVAGGGCERLRQAGIEVVEGVENEACRRLIHPFAHFATTNMPFITVKRAFNAENTMIPPKGQKTFTSKTSLILAHKLRKKADAIITGSGTILADNPHFTVRHVSDHKGKRRILAILDRRGRVSAEYIDQATNRNFDVKIYQNLDFCLQELAECDVRDILVESGPLLSNSVLESVDWAMKIDIHSGNSDQIDLIFNPKQQMPFNTKELRIEALLPL